MTEVGMQPFELDLVLPDILFVFLLLGLFPPPAYSILWSCNEINLPVLAVEWVMVIGMTYVAWRFARTKGGASGNVKGVGR